MEDYAAKMALKPVAALREYVGNYAQYQEAAVLAALDELRRREQPAPEDAALRPQLEAIVQQAVAKASAQAATQAEEDELPHLYSPTGIVVMSATVSVVAGAVLLAMNMYRLKRSRAIIGLAAFVLVYMGLRIVLLKWLQGQGMLLPATFLIDLPIIIAYVWWFWPRYVGTYRFQPRNWLVPLVGCFLFLLGMIFLNPETAKQFKQQFSQLQQQQK